MGDRGRGVGGGVCNLEKENGLMVRNFSKFLLTLRIPSSSFSICISN